MFTVIFIALLVSVGIGIWIGASKGQPHLGALLGLLGPLGWLIAAFAITPSYDKQVEREVMRRQVVRAAADIGRPGVPGTLDSLSAAQVRSMTSAEQRAYARHGVIPARFTKSAV